MSSAARSFELRSAASVAQVVAELDNASSVPDMASPSSSSPPIASTVGGLDFRAAQISKDAELAEELQREEYRREEVRVERRRQRLAAAEAEQNTSWTNWLMGAAPSAQANASSEAASSPVARARTTARPSSSVATRGGGVGARVAQPSSSIFACVAQSVSSVMGPPQAQVRGVDSTSLL